MSEKEEIKCLFCGKISNIADLPWYIETTDIYLGMDWGIPSWKENVIRYCPKCRFRLMRNNKKIEYKIKGEIEKT